MIPNRKKHKTIKLTKGKRLWSSEPEETCNPFGKTKREKQQKYASYSFRIPLTAQHIETIYRDGKVVWERSNESTLNSGIIGGGGRFFWRRKWFSRKLVAVELEFRDIPMRGASDPVFEISVRL